jgi:hypothetical protein
VGSRHAGCATPGAFRHRKHAHERRARARLCQLSSPILGVCSSSPFSCTPPVATISFGVTSPELFELPGGGGRFFRRRWPSARAPHARVGPLKTAKISVTSAKGLRRGKFPRALRKKWIFSAILKRFQAISSDFKPILTHDWASHPCIGHPYLGWARLRRKYGHKARIDAAKGR